MARRDNDNNLDIMDKLILKPKRLLFIVFVYSVALLVGASVLTYLLVVEFKLYDSEMLSQTIVEITAQIKARHQMIIENAAEKKENEQRAVQEQLALEAKQEADRIANAPKPLETRMGLIMLSKLSGANIYELEKSLELYELHYKIDSNISAKINLRTDDNNPVGYIMTDSTGTGIQSVTIPKGAARFCIDESFGVNMKKEDIRDLVSRNVGIYTLGTETHREVNVTHKNYKITYRYSGFLRANTETTIEFITETSENGEESSGEGGQGAEANSPR
jgi:hypothetical protein